MARIEPVVFESAQLGQFVSWTDLKDRQVDLKSRVNKVIVVNIETLSL